ncbi:hypothetical protein E4T56_gene5451 [Termitomyces sp. T112]|nr:hypothetical protein E4T56_gene5451 [Termitomyces sp. T112]
MRDELTSADTALQVLENNLLHIASLSILVYDHLVTFGHEVTYIWRCPKTKSTYWFFLNRYFVLLSLTMKTAFVLGKAQPEKCVQALLPKSTPYQHFVTIVGVLISLRLYALYDRSHKIVWYIVGGFSTTIGLAVWALFRQKNAPVPPVSGCLVGLSYPTAIHIVVPWEAIFVYDTASFVLVMVKTWKNRVEFSIQRTWVSLQYIIVRDGAIYYVVVALVNLANILTFYFCGPFMRGGLSIFSNAMSSMMMSRLMLNLHKVANSGIYTTSRETQSQHQAANPEIVLRDLRVHS